ncbi:MarR family transcriptional regulator [Paenibacillus sp. IB182496]|uniref:MarR family transcriptional regulator n=1 Tax=Paenibacillus sabuli TaxID=2772509 RepID=A0A927BPW2_9BACL|nr:MarR family transcriptional regulator [Paenibacillus sabuli]MBD2844526.1 MarR family transcriptional regulator [Paenibacillus sabuli]
MRTREEQERHWQHLNRLDEAFRQLRKLLLTEWNKRGVAGLGVTQAKLLFKLSAQGAQKVSALAEMLAVTSGAVTGMADQLIEQGLVSRERSETDRRIVMLDITEEGRKLVEDINSRKLEIMELLTVGLEEGELQELSRLMGKLVDAHAQRD